MGWHPISIHALREESDVLNTIYSTRANDFNPRPPRGERRCVTPFNYRGTLFQSTPSARRATSLRCKISGRRPDFNPRPPRGGRQTISWADQPKVRFQSTPSARRATGSNWSYGTSHSISIHALREEGDNRTRNQSNRQNRFQSTPSARRATANLGEQAVLKKISIHALREEGDLRSTGARWQSIPYFNPRPPRGGRQKPMRGGIRL